MSWTPGPGKAVHSRQAGSLARAERWETLLLFAVSCVGKSATLSSLRLLGSGSRGILSLV